MLRELKIFSIIIVVLAIGLFAMRQCIMTQMDEAAEKEAQIQLAIAKAEAKLSPSQLKAKRKKEHDLKERAKADAKKRNAENKKRSDAQWAKQKAKQQAMLNAPPSVKHSTAWIAAQDAVKDQLKSPSSAEFPPFDQEFVFKRKPNEFKVTSYVDADNSFGANLRNNFVCDIVFKNETDYNAKCVLLE